jgi:hypothetical protein
LKNTKIQKHKNTKRKKNLLIFKSKFPPLSA